jgi:predicted SPOUT superfamily RNA methylase MTH1
MDKTIKIGTIARACAIFNVETIYVYHDISSDYENDHQLILNLLQYIESPQYLRKRIFKLNKNLKFAGLLPPLRTPHHKSRVKYSEIKIGEFREGVIIKSNKKSYVDVGLPDYIPVNGNVKDGQRVTVRFISLYPNICCEVASKKDINIYWGFEVISCNSLTNLLKVSNVNLTLFTSKYGINLFEIWNDLIIKFKMIPKVLIIFGSPKKGIHDIIKQEHLSILSNSIVNFLPDQGVKTVRTEEALLSTLSLLNFVRQMAKL